MYLDYFGLKEIPFSIAPDPRYLYMSERHREALAHLLYGVSGQGGFIVLTGEVGTGKTTICRCFLNQVPKNTDVAFIVNPKLSARELLASICDEFNIVYPASASIKIFNDLINAHLLKAHAENRHTVLIIDEAQNLRVDVLEQLRLLTNLETSEKKLLQIILLGQPELREVLAQNELRQLAQRVTARYHLRELNKMEVGAYVRCRLSVAGRKGRLFSVSALNKLYRVSKGVPRLINLISDRALLGAYAIQSDMIEPKHITNAFREIQGEKVKVKRDNSRKRSWITPSLVTGIALGVISFGFVDRYYLNDSVGQSISDELNRLSATELGWSIDEPKPESMALDKLTINHTQHDADHLNLNNQVDEPQTGTTLDTALPIVEAMADKPSTGLIDSFRPISSDRFYAYQSIFKQWQVDYTKEPLTLACDFAELNGLRCLHKRGNWRSLIKLDRPSVLILVNNKGEKLYLGLLSVDESLAKVSYQGQLFDMSVDEIDRYWLGEYSLVWKLPPYKSLVIAPGQEHEEGKWLVAQFNELQDRSLEGVSSDSSKAAVKDESLESKVKRFQQLSGLIPDGIAGSLTIIHLNNKLLVDYPKLLGPPKG